ncbi:Gfo/Idh/MocA family oxidoreductase [Stieleria sp. TO1_6]|uniref:Gfo/Idh/MocA family protein n=1 Tax=Stieleria tagensis TaxID=2956795 RepID=UPI00209AE4A1|nr:Gfo/Idh/MocA family oxidoreductase [Stieleria tagensis]MCO8121161.1 Gfo/Idh/MocA family oxidoreductase [Stieleria tagensis]
MNKRPCRWGILSSAQIARKNWKAIELSGNGVVHGVSSRSVDRAEQFINDCQAEVAFDQRPKAYAGHQALLDDDQIDAVYIPMPTGSRKQWVIAAAAAKKHVLIEKPIAVNAADAQEMLDACNQNGVQFMDGVMFDHGKRIAAVCDQVTAGKIGRLRRIQTHFSFTGDSEFQSANIRTDTTLEPHGCLGDLGWYCIRFILWANGFADPIQVSGRTITPLSRDDSDDSVPGEFAGELVFANGVTAGFFCSFLTANQQLATLSGDQGYLTLDDFVLPLYDSETSWQIHRHELAIDNCCWNFRRRSDWFHCDEYHSGQPNAQEVQMVRTFAKYVNSGQIDSSLADRAVQTQRILDACRRSDAMGGQLIPFDTGA